MNEPTRLRHEHASALEHALLNAGATTVSSRETRDKTMAALGLAGSATILAGAIGATSVSSLAKAGWIKLVAGLSLVGAAAAVPVGYYVHRHQMVSHVPAAVVAPAPKTVGAARTLSATVPAPSVLAEAPRAAKGGPPTGNLTRELAALDAASTALAAGNGIGALALLDTYAQAYPHGRLEIEAEVLRIGALARSGRLEAARVRAETFLRRHPQSVLASRVRAEARLAD
jgi:hypothetical protein